MADEQLMLPHEAELKKKEKHDELLSSWKYPIFILALNFIPSFAVEMIMIHALNLPALFAATAVTLLWIVLTFVFELPKRAFLKLFG